jgi:SAM-dependent methyltransferase
MMCRRALLFAPAIQVLRGQKPAGSMFANAEAYERFMGRSSRLVAPRLVDFARLPEQGRVLDVGSGTGSLAAAIARRHPRARVVGIDPSSEYIGYAAGGNAHRERVSFEVGDAQQLHFEDASFDGAASLLVFNFIPDPKKALMELRRVTKPGGGIAAAVWDYGDGMRMLRIFWDAVVSVDPPAEKLDEKHMPLCGGGDLVALWRQCGLKDVAEQPIDIETKFASFADYWEPFLLGQGPAGVYARRLDGARLDALKREVKRRLGVAAEAAPIVLAARVWSVRGTVSMPE